MTAKDHTGIWETSHKISDGNDVRKQQDNQTRKIHEREKRYMWLVLVHPFIGLKTDMSIVNNKTTPVSVTQSFLFYWSTVKNFIQQTGRSRWPIWPWPQNISWKNSLLSANCSDLIRLLLIYYLHQGGGNAIASVCVTEL